MVGRNPEFRKARAVLFAFSCTAKMPICTKGRSRALVATGAGLAAGAGATGAAEAGPSKGKAAIV